MKLGTFSLLLSTLFLHLTVTEPENSPPQISKCGIKNLGNTCFMNSILQFMFLNYPLREKVMKVDDCVGKPMLCNLGKIFKHMSEKNTAVDETVGDGALIKFREIFHGIGFPKGQMEGCKEFIKKVHEIAKTEDVSISNLIFSYHTSYNGTVKQEGINQYSTVYDVYPTIEKSLKRLRESTWSGGLKLADRLSFYIPRLDWNYQFQLDTTGFNDGAEEFFYDLYAFATSGSHSVLIVRHGFDYSEPTKNTPEKEYSWVVFNDSSRTVISHSDMLRTYSGGNKIFYSHYINRKEAPKFFAPFDVKQTPPEPPTTPNDKNDALGRNGNILFVIVQIISLFLLRLEFFR